MTKVKSTQTTVTGLVAAAMLLLTAVLERFNIQMDDDLHLALSSLLAVAIGGLGLAARDNRRTSEGALAPGYDKKKRAARCPTEQHPMDL